MNTLLTLGIAHVLGDYLLQTGRLAEAKTRRVGWLALHAALYAAAMSVVFLCAPWYAALPTFLITILTHWGIDASRVAIERRRSSARIQLALFCVDQALHLAVIIICWAIFLRGRQTEVFAWLGGRPLFRVGLVHTSILCILWDPASVLVRKALGCFTPSDDAAETPRQMQLVRSGALIGKLERLITVALVICGAATAVGFVLTAKSIARFKQFEEKDFAERYLVGTLLSVSIALLAAIILPKFV